MAKQPPTPEQLAEWRRMVESGASDFYDASREAIPALIDEVERLREELWECKIAASAEATERRIMHDLGDELARHVEWYLRIRDSLEPGEWPSDAILRLRLVLNAYNKHRRCNADG